MKLIVASVDTGHFDWMALGHTREECNAALQSAYDRHCESRFIFAESALMDDLIEMGDVNYHEIEVGEALRDGSPVPPP